MPDLDHSLLPVSDLGDQEGDSLIIRQVQKYRLTVTGFRILAAARYRWLYLDGPGRGASLEMPHGYGRRSNVSEASVTKVLLDGLVTNKFKPELTDFGKRIYNREVAAGWRVFAEPYSKAWVEFHGDEV